MTIELNTLISIRNVIRYNIFNEIMHLYRMIVRFYIFKEGVKMVTVYDFTVEKPNGASQSLQDFTGKPLIIVNTASKCGLKGQFGDLQAIYEEYKERDLMILGFPCSQFNNQEFDDIEETTKFCQLNYGVTFPMFAKIDVNGDEAHPLFNYLKQNKGGMFSNDIKWNFTKFLIDREGNVVKRFAPTTKPSKMKKDIEKLL